MSGVLVMEGFWAPGNSGKELQVPLVTSAEGREWRRWCVCWGPGSMSRLKLFVLFLQPTIPFLLNIFPNLWCYGLKMEINGTVSSNEVACKSSMCEINKKPRWSGRGLQTLLWLWGCAWNPLEPCLYPQSTFCSSWDLLHTPPSTFP